MCVFFFFGYQSLDVCSLSSAICTCTYTYPASTCSLFDCSFSFRLLLCTVLLIAAKAHRKYISFHCPDFNMLPRRDPIYVSSQSSTNICMYMYMNMHKYVYAVLPPLRERLITVITCPSGVWQKSDPEYYLLKTASQN